MWMLIPTDVLLKGLAYVDFINDPHLATAIAKNKRMLLGKRLSSAWSNPKDREKESGSQSDQMKHAQTCKQNGNARTSASEESSAGQNSAATRNCGKNIQHKDRNTIAMPRNVRRLGVTARKPKAEEGEDEKPKSNNEFRKMFIKKD